MARHRYACTSAHVGDVRYYSLLIFADYSRNDKKELRKERLAFEKAKQVDSANRGMWFAEPRKVRASGIRSTPPNLIFCALARSRKLPSCERRMA